MARIKVVTDSACDLPDDIVAANHIGVVPLTIRFGAEEFVDRADLSPSQFWAKCKDSPVLPETAAPAPGAFTAAFTAAKAEGYDGVLAVMLSAKLSATHQAAVLGAEAASSVLPVRVLDSTAVSMAQGLIVLDLAEKASSDTTLDALYDYGQSVVARVGVIATIDTLDHLVKGGRVKGVRALLGSVLSIKPLLQLKDGEVIEAGRQRTRTRALTTCVAAAEAAAPLRRLAVVHGAAADVDVVTSSLAGVKTEFPLVLADMGSVVGTHGGPGIVAICWIRAS